MFARLFISLTLGAVFVVYTTASARESSAAHARASVAQANRDDKSRAFFESLPASKGSVDIQSIDGNGFAGDCSATPMENVEVSPGTCEVSLFTANHCVANLALSRQPNRHLIIRTTQGGLRIPPTKFQIHSATGNHARFIAGGPRSSTNSGDSAAIVIQDACHRLKFLAPVALGDGPDRGRTDLTQSLFFQKRISPNPFNRGGGARLRGYYDALEPDGQVRYHLPSPQGLIATGDSGSGIFDSFGRLVGAISGSSASDGQYPGPAFTVKFDAYGIQWAKRFLAQRKAARPAPTPTIPTPVDAPAQPQPQLARVDSGPTTRDAPAVSPRPVRRSVFARPNRIPTARDHHQSAASSGTSPQPVTIDMPDFGSKYFVDNEWRDYIPVRANMAGGQVTSINGQPVPAGAIGYRLGDNGSMAWVGPGDLNRAPMTSPFSGPPRSASAGTDSGRSIGTMGSIGVMGSRPSTPSEPTGITAIDGYRNLRYPNTDIIRQRFGRDMFTDIPDGGTGKLRLAYIGPRDLALEQSVAGNPLVEVRHYPMNSPEAAHALLFQTQALGVDGLGRKITRYAMPPRMALESLLQDELPRLEKYLAATKALAGNPSVPRTSTAPATRSAPVPSTQTPAKETPAPTATADSLASAHADLSAGVKACASCHAGTENVPPSMKSPDTLLANLGGMNETLLNEMLRRASLGGAEHQAIKQFAERARAQIPRSDVEPSARVPACFTSDADRVRLASNLPELEANSSRIAGSLASAKQSTNLIFYDSASVPRTWQEASMVERQSRRLLSERIPERGGSMGANGYHADGSREFPWKHTAGLDISPNASASKFIIPPTQGPIARLVTRTKANSPDYFGKSVNVNGPELGWNYNPGTTFGENLKMDGVTFEIRLRRKGDDGNWQMDVLRPFENSAELAQGLKKLCASSNRPPGCDSVTPSLIAKIENPVSQVLDRSAFVNARTMGTRRDPLSINASAATALQTTATVETLPDLPKDVVKALLTTTPFKSVFNKPWRQANPPGWAPLGGITPKNYFGAFLPMNQQGCVKCHDAAGRHVDNFDPVGNQMNAPARDDNPSRRRTWYNFIRGNDRILSFHPFAPSAVAQGAQADQNALAPCLVQSGLIR